MRGPWRPLAAVIGGVAIVASSAAAATAGGPVLSAVSPPSVVPGGTLTLSGSGFGTAGPAAAVAFLGPDVTQPEVFGKVLRWTPNAITVQVPSVDVWPGQAVVQVENPGIWSGASNRLPVMVAPAGDAIVEPVTEWVPATGAENPAGQPASGTLHVGWYNADGAPVTPISLTLPAELEVAPGAAATLDGTAAGLQVSGQRLTIVPGAGVSVPGQVTVAVSGVTAEVGNGSVGIGVGSASATATLSVGTADVVGYQVQLPVGVQPGVPFPVRIQAVGADGGAVASAGTVYLSSGGLLDFRGAQQTASGPSTASVALTGGFAEVTAVAPVAGPVTVQVQDGAGVAGTAGLQVQSTGGVQVTVYPPFSDYAGTPSAMFTAGNVDARALRSGALVEPAGATRPIYGGFWPTGIGQAYEAVWTGTLTVQAPAPLPSPLPQPASQYALLNVSAQGGGATLTPVPETGASVNGGTGPLSIPTATTSTGWVPPLVVTLTPGQYQVSVRTAENAAQGGAGDTLYYSQGFSGTPGWPGTAAPTLWAPMVPVPPAAFGGAGLPDPALSVTIGAPVADDAGAPVALPQAPLIENGRTLLPLRSLAELLGARVDWDAATQGITVTDAGVASGRTTQALLTVGSSTAYVNGSAVTLDQPPVVLPPGVTMVPLRFLAQVLGWQVAWDGTRRAAVLLPPLSGSVPVRP